MTLPSAIDMAESIDRMLNCLCLDDLLSLKSALACSLYWRQCYQCGVAEHWYRRVGPGALDFVPICPRDVPELYLGYYCDCCELNGDLEREFVILARQRLSVTAEPWWKYFA